MKIGLCGTMSVGKTTLVNALKEIPEFKDYKFATERSKYLNSLGIPLNYKTTIEGQTIFLAERVTELMQENIITDRTIIDVMAFTECATHTSIIDAATAFYKGMGRGYEDKFMIVSFHFKKILNIGQGGMILTNRPEFNEWARPMIYDGRHKDRMYKDDEFDCVGWHMYMGPESAKKGLEIFNSSTIQEFNQHCGSSETYGDLRKQKIYEEYI